MVESAQPNSIVLYTSFTVRHPDGERHDQKLVGSGKLVIGTGTKDVTRFTNDILYVGILSMKHQQYDIGYYFLNDRMVKFTKSKKEIEMQEKFRQ